MRPRGAPVSRDRRPRVFVTTPGTPLGVALDHEKCLETTKTIWSFLVAKVQKKCLAQNVQDICKSGICGTALYQLFRVPCCGIPHGSLYCARPNVIPILFARDSKHPAAGAALAASAWGRKDGAVVGGWRDLGVAGVRRGARERWRAARRPFSGAPAGA
jgi:hypothetical protein